MRPLCVSQKSATLQFCDNRIWPRAACGQAGLADNGAMAVKILIVEDDDRIRAALGLALREEDYVVVEARDVSEGWRSTNVST